MDQARTRHADLIAAVLSALFESPAESEPALRRAVGAGDQVPEPWAPYAEKVRTSSYRITAADVAALRAAGRTEEEIFEVTVAAATGAALQRLDAGLAALRGGGPT
jgi:alkylhydroperoxidase family enzyme